MRYLDGFGWLWKWKWWEGSGFLLFLPPGCSSWKAETLKTSLSMTIHMSSGLLCEATSPREYVLDMWERINEFYLIQWRKA